jgi:small-conductance mechanosensitive channel
MTDLTALIQAWTGLSPETQGRLFSTLVVVLGLWLVRWLTLRLVRRRIENVTQRYYWSRVVTYLIVFIGLLVVGRIWFQGVSSLVTYFGLLSAGLAIALSDLVANLAGWFFILWRRPFVVGDRIEIAGQRGDVIDIRLFMFSLLEIGNWVDADQSTGRIIHVPNGKVLKEPLANYTMGFKFIWHEIPVLVTFESDWRKAKEILERIVHEHAEPLSADAERQVRQAAHKYMIHYGKLTPIVYLTVKDSGVMLTMRFMVDPRRRRGIEEGIWQAVLEAFAAESDIDLAYPTIRYYDNRGEGGTGRDRQTELPPDAS